MSKEESLLDEWQQRLGLHDWLISLKCNCEQENMKLDNCNAESEWVTSIKTACIRVMPDDKTKTGIVPYDFEQMLIHELLHIKFGYLQCDPKSYEETVFDEAQHQLIDDLPRAFVMAKRGTVKRETAGERCKESV